ncbi:DnaJ like protein [Dictyocoela muelleri]|nr:DnaJ like protein [Dictyocoela muelleri]
MEHYNTLQITRDATQDEIEKAFKKLIILYHPDQGGDYKKFMKILESYSILKDSYKRKFYDILGNTIIKDIGIIDTIPFLLTRLTTFIFSICILLLSVSIYLFPVFVFYKKEILILPQIILSKVFLSIAFIIRIVKKNNSTDLRNMILKIYFIISLFHMLMSFYVLWYGSYLHTMVVLSFYIIFDLGLSIFIYQNRQSRMILLFAFYRISCITIAFMVENLNLKLFMMILYSIELSFISWSYQSLVCIIALINYFCSVYFCNKNVFTPLICVTCSINYVFFLIMIFLIFNSL